jgi:hypothetical protein
MLYIAIIHIIIYEMYRYTLPCTKRAKEVCCAFWKHLFTELCSSAAKCELNPAQRFLTAHKETLLFPVSKTTAVIYNDHFHQWMGQTYPDMAIPSLSTFKRARGNADFDNVSTRAKHFHAICNKCASFTARRRQGFFNRVFITMKHVTPRFAFHKIEYHRAWTYKY